MKSATYDIRAHGNGWTIEHDGEMSGPYDTREGAFEAAIGPASNSIKLGFAVSITVEAPKKGSSALGAR